MINDLIVREAAYDMQFVDNLCAFTWVPDPKRFSSTSPSAQYKSILGILYKHLPVFGTFIFTPELTKNGNIHIHGMYTIKNKVKYFREVLPCFKGIGNVQVKDVFDEEGWIHYLAKSVPQVIDILDHHCPVPLTHYNVDVYKSHYYKQKRLQRLKDRLYLKRGKKMYKKNVIKWITQEGKVVTNLERPQDGDWKMSGACQLPPEELKE